MTEIPSQYGCRNCNLRFVVGVAFDPRTSPSMYHHYTCGDCGWVYQVKSTSNSISHPLSWLFYTLPSFLNLKPNRKEMKAIKSTIHEDMLMSDVAVIMKALPIRKQWFSSFQYNYEEARKILGNHITYITVKQLLEACEKYKHTTIELYASNTILELPHNGAYWEHHEHYLSLSYEKNEKSNLYNSNLRRLEQHTHNMII